MCVRVFQRVSENVLYGTINDLQIAQTFQIDIIDDYMTIFVTPGTYLTEW